MADIRIKDLATTASSAASDDFMALDGATNGTRKMSAANPSVTTLTTSGVIAPGGSVHGANGAVGNPSFAFLSNQNTGLYRIGLDNIGVAANGAKVLDIATTGLGITGTATISSTTAGSSGAGALVVQGGISAGNTGSAASYFGGGINLTTGASGTSQLTIANTNGNGKAHVGSFGSSTYLSTNYFYVSGQTTDDATLGSANIVLGVDRTIKFSSAAASATPANSLILTLDGATNAATFAGAVEITGATTLNNDVYQTALKKFYVDSGSNTYFHENSADSFQIVTGGTVSSTLTAGSVLFNGIVIGPATTANYASIRLPHGTTAPTSPVNGDMWTTTAGLFIRINGVTKTVTLI